MADQPQRDGMAETRDEIGTRLDAILLELRSVHALLAELLNELRKPPAPIPLDPARRRRR